MDDGPHKRRCWDCGNLAEHKYPIMPWVLCAKCGSLDTRRVKRLEPQKYPDYQVPAVEQTPVTWRVLSVEWDETLEGQQVTVLTVNGNISPVGAGDEIIYVRAE